MTVLDTVIIIMLYASNITRAAVWPSKWATKQFKPESSVDRETPAKRNNKSYRCCHTDCYESHPLFSARHVSIPLG